MTLFFILFILVKSEAIYCSAAATKIELYLKILSALRHFFEYSFDLAVFLEQIDGYLLACSLMNLFIKEKNLMD